MGPWGQARVAAGIAYLVTLPFRESLREGLANVLIPFYAVYYWTTRWPRMKTPVYQTAKSFTPILLAAIGYFAYKEAPVVERAIEKEFPAFEKALDERIAPLDRKAQELLDPLEKTRGRGRS